MKRTWIVIVLLAVLTSCQLIPGFTPTPTLAPTPQPPTATPAPVAKPLTPVPSETPTSTSTPFGPWLLVPESSNVSSAKPPFEITLQYPEIANPVTPGLAAFNAESKKLAQDLVAGFQKDFSQVESFPEPSAAGGSFMQTTYTVTYGQNGLLSVLYRVAFYMSGAAHPNSNAAVINFDLIHGKKLELADLFQPGSDYLTAIADYCTTELKNQDYLLFPDGALPKPENYKNWSITPQGLQITFDPYQVAAYAMGPSQVIIPYASLKSQLKPDGPLSVLTH